MNWYSPLDPPQLLPKDLLHYARKFTKAEAEASILAIIKNAIKRIVGVPNRGVIDDLNYWVDLQALQQQAILREEAEARARRVERMWTTSLPQAYTTTNAIGTTWTGTGTTQNTWSYTL